MVVLKFGGTSVANAEALRRVAGIVAAEPRPRAVVVSALAGVTDALVQLAEAGGTVPGAPPPRPLDALLRRHTAAAQMIRARDRRAALEHELYAVAAQIAATLEAAPGRLPPRLRDAVVAAGELWSSRLLAAVLEDRGIRTAWVDARRVFRTDSRHGAAVPDTAATRQNAMALVDPLLADGTVAVLGGFIGSDAAGATTTLGRGGSDYSAAVLGKCLDAAEIQIWTDVDGVLTADPRVVPHARPVPRLSYGEAQDLATFGAKVLHPATIQPAVDRGIPLLVRNSHRPGAPGTVVGPHEAAPAAIAGLACRTGAALIEATARDPHADEQFAADVFAVLARLGIEAVLVDRLGPRLMITVQDLADADAVRASLSVLASVRVVTDLATVSLVGEGLAADGGVPARAIEALAEVPVHLVSRPSGGRTLAFLVEGRATSQAVARLHDCFFAAAPRRRAGRRAVQA